MAKRDTRITRKQVKDSEILQIWARAAGRCVLCSTYLLGGESSYFHTASHGEVAHNVGATSGKGSTRGTTSDLTKDERASRENLLLLCHRCHRNVDTEGAENIYTEAHLKAKKLAHEERVRKVTDHATVHETAVLRVTGRIRGRFAPATNRQIAEALFNEDLRFAGEHPRESTFTVEAKADETDEWVWKQGAQEISRKVAQLHDAPYETVSVFAMAPIPLLVHLGSELDDKTDVRLFQRFRGEEDLAWTWRNASPQVPQFELSSSSPDGSVRDVVLTVSLTGPVQADRAPKTLTGLPQIHLRAEFPSPDVIQTKADLNAFAKAWRDALAQVEAHYPLCERIHLLAAVPLVAAIACGQHHMRDAHPSMVVYQRAGEDYVEALQVRGAA